MRKLTLLLTTLVFSLTMMFSSPSYAEWTKIGVDVKSGDTYYADFDRIRKVGGYVYFWVLTDYLKPKLGDLSVKVYNQGDCKLFRGKPLSFYSYKEPMGGGTGNHYTPPDEWTYPPPNSPMEHTLKKVCKVTN